MSVSSNVEATSSSNPDPLARLAFVGNVHRLFAMGYERVDTQNLNTANENRLTQLFVEALRAATEDPSAPEALINFSVHEKQKQNDGELEGNYRLELDICFERTGRGVHPIFKVEAKPLGPSHPVGTYLGPKGLGAFISTEYASEQEDAGMLGYVQSESIKVWVDVLAGKLNVSPGECNVSHDGIWQDNAFTGGPAHTYRTRHSRQGEFPCITVFHTLLDFRA